ncbi:MAG TPA: hypothetical protein VFZ09_36180 [Archangium sp.]|uniref:hypothetical protein n=1 Tax=Archangium sp. TaxID=1872627 RepID=UPI002E36F143|nr:hypothetical protein [Archangium sp.]HEX5751714.1 hypothetical protein [Archangium sp.]
MWKGPSVWIPGAKTPLLGSRTCTRQPTPGKSMVLFPVMTSRSRPGETCSRSTSTEWVYAVLPETESAGVAQVSS